MAPKINESKTAKQRSDDLKKNMSDSPNRSGDQKHLSYVQKTNLGSFYTPPEIVAMVGELIDKHIPNDSREWTVLDSSCGYGAFLDIKLNRRVCGFVGGDIDGIALQVARTRYPSSSFYEANALKNVSREKYDIAKDAPLIVVGNPPYNDTTSMVKNWAKRSDSVFIDTDIRTRDLGISFLLSFEKLCADFIVVLHPLSYLIKKANFQLLAPFFRRYALKDCVVINSQRFSETSRGTGFPIAIAFYEKSSFGMRHSEIEARRFVTDEGKSFCVRDFDYIKNYISKYPKKRPPNFQGFRFFTMRDINALKRSRTFISEDTANTIYVDEDKLDYYCYVDAFKNIANRLPYYFGNFDVMFDHAEFLKIRESFLVFSAFNHPELFSDIRRKFSSEDFSRARKYIGKYFQQLLGGHRV